MIQELQNQVLKLSPALIPLFTFPIAFVQSWHCSMMCGPLVSIKSTGQRNRYFQGRWISYTMAGGLCGAFGESLSRSLEVQFFGVIGFLFFFVLSLVLVLSWFGLSMKLFKIPAIGVEYLKQASLKSSFWHGLVSVALPCGLLYQVFGLSVLSRSLYAGLLIGSAHAVATMPGFLLSGRILKYFKGPDGKKAQSFFRVFLVFLIVINLFYFAGHLLHPADVVKSKILFCF